MQNVQGRVTWKNREDLLFWKICDALRIWDLLQNLKNLKKIMEECYI